MARAEESAGGIIVRIEFVGGPLCGHTKSVKNLDAEIVVNGEGYRRRDRAFTLSLPTGACYGVNGYRMYDHVRNGSENG
jgi:hypothetical protein